MIALRILVCVLFVSVVSCFLTVSFLLGPMLTYFYLSSEDTRACLSVKTARTRGDVLKMVHSSLSPYSEYLDSQSRFIFRGPHYACTVNFDSAGVVTGVETNRAGYQEFLTEATE